MSRPPKVRLPARAPYDVIAGSRFDVEEADAVGLDAVSISFLNDLDADLAAEEEEARLEDEREESFSARADLGVRGRA